MVANGCRLDLWQPLLLSNQVRRRPVPFRLYDREFVAFRGVDGRVGVLRNACPHRGMRLSKGRINDQCLVCPYHGWRFDADGRGESRGNPRIHVSAPHLLAKEAHGAIWVKEADSLSEEMPKLATTGYSLLHAENSRFAAPVELLLDNFTEVEHTAAAHWQFGYDENRLAEVVVSTSTDAVSVTAESRGPQKPLMRFGRWLLGIGPDDRLIVRWTTFYRPVHAVFDWWWEDPATMQPRACKFREIAFFNRTSERESALLSFYYWTLPRSGSSAVTAMVTAIMRQVVRYEIEIDRSLIENVIVSPTGLSGGRLGRFDTMVSEHRKRLPWRVPGGETSRS